MVTSFLLWRKDTHTHTQARATHTHSIIHTSTYINSVTVHIVNEMTVTQSNVMDIGVADLVGL